MGALYFEMEGLQADEPQSAKRHAILTWCKRRQSESKDCEYLDTGILSPAKEKGAATVKTRRHAMSVVATGKAIFVGVALSGIRRRL
jgi:hypothetical protein